MEEYPRTIAELEANFATDEACRAYLTRLRWPEGLVCRRCGREKFWPVRGKLLECSSCGCQISVTAGTIFQDTRTPLPVWFRARWWVTTQKNGASALGLQRVLGLKSYETAWAWMHKLRRAMVRSGRDLLSGAVEVDETCLGGLEEGLRGRLIEDKALICRGCSGRQKRHWTHPHAPHSGRVGRQPGAFSAGVSPGGQRGTHRRLAGLQRSQGKRICPQGDCHQGQPVDSIRVDAARPPSRSE